MHTWRLLQLTSSKSSGRGNERTPKDTARSVFCSWPPEALTSLSQRLRRRIYNQNFLHFQSAGIGLALAQERVFSPRELWFIATKDAFLSAVKDDRVDNYMESVAAEFREKFGPGRPDHEGYRRVCHIFISQMSVLTCHFSVSAAVSLTPIFYIFGVLEYV